MDFQKVSEAEARSSFPEINDEEISAFCKEFNSTPFAIHTEKVDQVVTYEAVPCLGCGKNTVIRVESVTVDGFTITRGDMTFCKCCRTVLIGEKPN